MKRKKEKKAREREIQKFTTAQEPWQESIMFSQTATLALKHYFQTEPLQLHTHTHTHTQTHTVTTTYIRGLETAHDKFWTQYILSKRFNI